MLRLTPILVVDTIEPSLAFWVDRLGFQKLAETGSPGRLESVRLQRHGVEIMYRTAESAKKEFATVGGEAPGAIILAIEVENIEDLEKRLDGLDLIAPLRQTDYGGAEIIVREPGGHVIAFSAAAGY
jgi:uncharacterized glyoxalase superfamily protein PhnB